MVLRIAYTHTHTHTHRIQKQCIDAAGKGKTIITWSVSKAMELNKQKKEASAPSLSLRSLPPGGEILLSSTPSPWSVQIQHTRALTRRTFPSYKIRRNNTVHDA